MRLPAALILTAFLAAGCTAPPSAGGETLKGFKLGGYVAGAGPDYVEVETSFRSRVHRVERIELIAPDGRRHEAPELRTTVEANAGGLGRHGSVGLSGGSGGISHYGIGISLGFLFGGFGEDPPPTVRARGVILLPDPAAYRRDWRRWRIAVTTSRGGGAPEEHTAPAPAPGQ